ncbi:IS982 family transposase [Leptolyngbya sp. FACHB-321]|uniref:IS982 family transposase n=1 Tax=Leptolyngbya sp. FACHB-321 TaxID=2692807 RepID=UPI0016888F8C|nr:IS982 family transposase [Leptolyngbya sp. FACHB-321]MBD2034317.1 IS982 family transposase [Leptolyngbya sp. FACHB-321]
MFSLEELLCSVDDFCQVFEPRWQQQLLSHGLQRRNRARQLCLSEIMTIVIAFHQQRYRTFKDYYTKHVCVCWRTAFPALVSYQRFVAWMPSALLPFAYLKSCFGRCTGISFIDATRLQVCQNRRIHQHQVFAEFAARGKTSVDWFFGFKLHLVVNEHGELLNNRLTPGNTDDRKPVVPLLQALFGKVFADRGYVSQRLAQQLLKTCGIEFFAKPRRNMKNCLMRLTDKLLARKRSIIETIIDPLKNISQIEYSRHRSPVNFLTNLVCGLIAYCHQPKKPALRLEFALPQAA